MFWSHSDLNGFGNPWDGLRELGRILERGVEIAGGNYPRVNLWTNEDGVVLTAELPGVDPKAIEITVRGDVLTLRGERNSPELAEGARCVRCERANDKFERTIELPFAVNADGVEAAYELGVLKVTLPRAEEDKPKKIAIKL